MVVGGVVILEGPGGSIVTILGVVLWVTRSTVEVSLPESVKQTIIQTGTKLRQRMVKRQ